MGQRRAAAFFPRGATVVDAPVAPIVYDPTTPAWTQRRDWTCSICATGWALTSLGLVVDQEELVATMTPTPVSPAVGCLDASGAGLATFIREAYGVSARHTSVVRWEDVIAVAGQYPLLLGGRGWYHWVAGRALAGPALLIANSAPGYRGVYTSLSQEQFTSWLGPFSMVEVGWAG